MTLNEAQTKVKEYGWEIAVEHLHWLASALGCFMQSLRSGQCETTQ
jgi:hypothetical protein